MSSFGKYMEAHPRLFGNVDTLEIGSHVGGWICDETDSQAHPKQVVLEIDDVVIGHSWADLGRGDGYKGFRITATNANLDALLLQQRLKVFVLGDGRERVPLNIYTQLLDSLKKTSGEMGRSPIQNDLVTSIFVPVGTKATDGSAVIGYDGQLFLFKGSNDVAGLYALEPSSRAVTQVVDAWLSLITERKLLLQRQDCMYLQLVVPEKSSVLLESVPAGLGPITPILEGLESKLFATEKMGSKHNNYLSVVDVLRNPPSGRASAFLNTDSHLSSDGCQVIVEAILAWLLNDKPNLAEDLMKTRASFERRQMSPPTLFRGDLSSRFASFPLLEWVSWPVVGLSDSANSASTDVLYTPPDGGHGGTHIRWRNENAPIRLRVVAFGNSFFERGAAQYGLSWWCKGLFKEFHFVWNSAIVPELVASIQPQLVICQTVERFLHIIPKM